MRSIADARVLVLGGAGFLGSHLCDAALEYGATVTAVDNLSTGRSKNLAHLRAQPRFTLREADITDPFDTTDRFDIVVNMASPASPTEYLQVPVETLRTGSLGTEHALELARKHEARFVQASTSEVYGDPKVSPQPETYWGNVNPVGPRAVYDEAKRYAEALTMAYRRAKDVNTGIVRIFNTYGPRMRIDDGRAVPAFFEAALRGRPLPVHGDGSQTRSLCYVDDLVLGVISMMESDHPGPVNIGNPEEISIRQLAETIQEVVGVECGIEFVARPVDDPSNRRPDISLAARVLGWRPEVPLGKGLELTRDWFIDVIGPNH